MADSSTSTETSDIPAQERAPREEHETNGQTAAQGAPPEVVPPAPPRRKVYESTLIPERRRMRMPAWGRLVLLAALILAAYYFVAAGHHRPVVNTIGKVVYSAKSDAAANSRIWIARFDGTGAVPLTPAGQDDDSPAFSPDGNQVALISTSGGVRQLFLMSADGKDLQPVTTSSEAKAAPAFAPSSNQVVGFTAAGVLYTASISASNVDMDRLLPIQENKPPDAQDTNSQDADSAGQADATVQQFAWAPATDVAAQPLAAVEETNGIQSLAIIPSIATGGIVTTHNTGTQVVPLAGANRVTVGWSPDGALLAAAMVGTMVDEKPASAIVLFDASGNPTQNTVLKLPSGTIGPENPVFSPDGSKIVFELWNESDVASRRSMGLFAVPISGGSQPVEIFGGNAEGARFAPDGSICFLAKRHDGGHDLLNVQADGTGLRRLSDGKEDVTAYSISTQHG
jgi:Tol biopolymer transport system component